MSPMEDHETLGAAKAWLREKASGKNGADCPCCGRRSKVYNRTIYATMARMLILALRQHGQEWFHAPTLAKGDRTMVGDFAKLSYWGLIEAGEGRREDGGKNGLWRLTARGVSFTRGLTTVPNHAVTYHAVVLGYLGEMVSIRDCLGRNFDYNELMNS